MFGELSALEIMVIVSALIVGFGAVHAMLSQKEDQVNTKPPDVPAQQDSRKDKSDQ
jgi:hypothetical protein